MKRIILTILAAFLLLSLAACGNKQQEPTTEPTAESGSISDSVPPAVSEESDIVIPLS